MFIHVVMHLQFPVVATYTDGSSMRSISVSFILNGVSYPAVTPASPKVGFDVSSWDGASTLNLFPLYGDLTANSVSPGAGNLYSWALYNEVKDCGHLLLTYLQCQLLTYHIEPVHSQTHVEYTNVLLCGEICRASIKLPAHGFFHHGT
jgi:hypothetical protein